MTLDLITNLICFSFCCFFCLLHLDCSALCLLHNHLHLFYLLLCWFWYIDVVKKRSKPEFAVLCTGDVRKEDGLNCIDFSEMKLQVRRALTHISDPFIGGFFSQSSFSLRWWQSLINFTHFYNSIPDNIQALFCFASSPPALSNSFSSWPHKKEATCSISTAWGVQSIWYF